MKQNDKALSIRMPKAMREDLQTIADSLGLKPADVIRLCIAAQLEHFQKSGEWILKKSNLKRLS